MYFYFFINYFMDVVILAHHNHLERYFKIIGSDHHLKYYKIFIYI